MLLKGDEGGLGGHYPLGHLRRGGGSISALRVTGDPAKGDPGGEVPPTPPPTPLFYWGDLSVTGNGALPLATQRRVESIASDRSPFAVAGPHLSAWSVVSYFLRYFSSTSTEQISPIPPDLSPVSIRLALLFLLLFAGDGQTNRSG